MIDRTETAALGSAQHIDFGDGPIERFDGILPARHREAYRALTSSSSVDLAFDSKSNN
ncbi:hypothetical protein [Mesorhizobium sp. M0589]|uniref:hypothetical protein n=1 Tax=Mesorhizobium sp. M0589 TaxID=2956965 RepID=UPI0033398FFE